MAIKNGKILLFMKIFSKAIDHSWYIKRFLLIKQALVWLIRLICASKAFLWMFFLFQTLAILFLLYYFHSIIQKMRYLFESSVFRFSAFNLQPFMKLFPKMFCLHSEKATLRLYFSERNNFLRCVFPLNGFYRDFSC